MFLSTLFINVGNNPDRPHPGRDWLRNLYRVHQRLCMAFPSASLRQDDPLFLKPYRPCGFADPRPQRCTVTGSGDTSAVCTAAGPNPPEIHVPRDGKHNFLFRVDPQPGGTVVIVVLSALEPDWNYAFGLKPGLLDDRGRPIGNAGHLLAGPPEKPRPIKLTIEPGKHFQFRLRANPTIKVHALPEGACRTTPLTKNGRRVPVQATKEAFLGWLGKQADRAGFRIEGEPLIQPGYVYVSKDGKPGQGHRLRSVVYEGILEVTDADAFAQTLAAGIGPAKAFGFGLLSVAPISS
jgi:CRISPR system Cascade subunit CasE